MRLFIVSILCLFLPIGTALAHPVSADISGLSTFVQFFYEGIRHIIPLGLDHILFITTVFLLAKSIRDVVTYSLLFTLAHSITLAMVILGFVSVSGDIIEPIIAFSIFILAIEVLKPFIMPAWKGGVVFFFGLFHGMGFAGVLSELGLPQTQLLTALLSFNIGVEVGQLMVIALLYFGTLLIFKHNQRRRVVSNTMAIIIAGIALFWCVERVFL